MTAHGNSKSGGYEHSDWDLRWVAGSVIFLVLGAVVIFALVWWIFMWFRNTEVRTRGTAPPVSSVQRMPPEPRLQVAPAEDWSEMYADEQRSLHSYAWVDRGNGVVRIPIDRAMDLLVQRGLPHRESKEAQK